MLCFPIKNIFIELIKSSIKQAHVSNILVLWNEIHFSFLEHLIKFSFLWNLIWFQSANQALCILLIDKNQM